MFFLQTWRLCSYLIDLELRLHLAAEDVDVVLEMDSARALQRIPAAVQEITHLKVGFGKFSTFCSIMFRLFAF